MKKDFIECDACASKPGSPTLCPSCLHNRAVICELKEEIRKLESRGKTAQDMLREALHRF